MAYRVNACLLFCSSTDSCHRRVKSNKELLHGIQSKRFEAFHLQTLSIITVGRQSASRECGNRQGWGCAYFTLSSVSAAVLKDLSGATQNKPTAQTSFSIPTTPEDHLGALCLSSRALLPRRSSFCEHRPQLSEGRTQRPRELTRLLPLRYT